MRAVVMVSSVNFALKSEDEQRGLIQGYMQFLNALDHPLQVVIQSRKLDIDGYIWRLKEAQKKQTNELLKNQIDDYIDFIKQLIVDQEIMTKRFFIVVPFNPLGSKKISFFGRLKESISPTQLIKINKTKFDKYKQELFLQVNNIVGNLRSLGLESAVLDTQGLIELYYTVYNPRTSQNEKMVDVASLNVEQ
jgi:hypothetical protein